MGNIFRCFVSGNGAVAGQDAGFGLHYEDITLLGDLTLPNLAESLEVALGLHGTGSFSASGVLSKIEVRGITDPTAGFDYPISIAGAVSGDMLPPQDAAVISWRTGLVGKAYRGRSFLPYQPEASQAYGVWASGWIDQLQLFADDLITLYDAATGFVPFARLVVHSTVLDGAPRAVPLDTPVNTALVNVFVKGQDRRKNR